MGATIDFDVTFKGSTDDLIARLESFLKNTVKKHQVEMVTPVYTSIGEDFGEIMQYQTGRKKHPVRDRYKYVMLGEIVHALGLRTLFSLNELGDEKEYEWEEFELFKKDPERWRKQYRKELKSDGWKVDDSDFQLVGPETWFNEKNLVRHKREWKKIEKLVEAMLDRIKEEHEQLPDEKTKDSFLKLNIKGDAIKTLDEISRTILEQSTLVVAGIGISAGTDFMLLPFLNWFNSGYFVHASFVKPSDAAEPAVSYKVNMEILKDLNDLGMILSIKDISRYIYSNNEEHIKKYILPEAAFVQTMRNLAKNNPESFLKLISPDKEIQSSDDYEIKFLAPDPEEVKEEMRRSRKRKN